MEELILSEELIEESNIEYPLEEGISSDSAAGSLVIEENQGTGTEEEEIVEDNSNEEIVLQLEQINENIKELKEDVIRSMEESTRDNSNVGDDTGNVSDNEIEYVTVSEDNIMLKPINEYTVTESFLFMIAGILLMAGIIILVKKGVPRWR